MDEVAGFWDEQAAGFDSEPDHGLRDPETRAAWAALLARLVPAPPARIADLGCGTGSLAVLLSRQGHRVSGIDLAPEMVRFARDKAAAVGVDAEFAVGDASAPRLPAGGFDVVLARHVVWALPDPDSALRRWIELLAPGGRLVLVEGRWSTGAGLTAPTLHALVTRCGRAAEIIPLPEPVYWGGPTGDERYALVSRARDDA